jgi:hypothetical protein
MRNMHWRRREAPERVFISCWIKSMDWRREAPERSSISFAYKFNKKHVLEEAGGSRMDFHQLCIRIKKNHALEEGGPREDFRQL